MPESRTSFLGGGPMSSCSCATLVVVIRRLETSNLTSAFELEAVLRAYGHRFRRYDWWRQYPVRLVGMVLGVDSTCVETS